MRDRVGWLSFRILGTSFAVLAVAYMLLHDTLDWLPAPSAAGLTLIAFCVWVVTWTLPPAVLAWTQPPPPHETD